MTPEVAIETILSWNDVQEEKVEDLCNNTISQFYRFQRQLYSSNMMK